MAGRNGERLAPEGMPWRAPPQPAAGCSDPARLPGVRRHVLAGAAFPGPSERRGSKASLSAGVEGRPRTWALHGAGSTGPSAPGILTRMSAPGGVPRLLSLTGGRKETSLRVFSKCASVLLAPVAIQLPLGPKSLRRKHLLPAGPELVLPDRSTSRTPEGLELSLEGVGGRR